MRRDFRLDSSLQSITLPVLIEADERVVFINHAYAEVLGFTNPAELIDRHISGLVAEVDRRRLVEFGRMRASGIGAPSEYPFLCKTRGGESVLMHASVSSAYEDGRCCITTVARPQKPDERTSPLALLSRRERMVFDLLAAGRRAKEIGLLLQISEKTVGTLRGRFMRKLGLSDSWDLFRFASRMEIADAHRLAAVSSTNLLDTGAEECFDRITRTASRTLRAPVAFLSLIDRHRDYYKSSVGFPRDLRELRGETFCHYVLLEREAVVIANTQEDEVHSRVPSVTTFGVKAYLGIPLVISNEIIGALCVIDYESREWTEADVAAMADLAAIASREIQLRQAATRSATLR